MLRSQSFELSAEARHRGVDNTPRNAGRSQQREIRCAIRAHDRGGRQIGVHPEMLPPRARLTVRLVATQMGKDCLLQLGELKRCAWRQIGVLLVRHDARPGVESAGLPYEPWAIAP